MQKLSNRIVLAMIMISFFSAIIGGILFQVRVSSLVRSIDERNLQEFSNTILSRLRGSRLPPRTIDEIETILELRTPLLSTRSVIMPALDQAVGVVILVAIVASILAFGLGWLLTRRIVLPLEKLRLASQQVATGDFAGRVAVSGNDEVGQVAYSFNLMATELQNAETKRRELLSDLAHEFKTPLASIQGHIEALRDNIPRAKADPQAIYDIVLEDVADLDKMIGSLRGWLNAQGMLENLQPINLNLITELPLVLTRFSPRAEAAQIKLKLELKNSPNEVLADRDALRHVLNNLVDNALCYTPKGGEVQLSAWQETPKTITLAISDTGCGIAPEHWPHLFKRFYRVDRSRTRDTGGTGLGLALVQDLVKAQNGRVWFTSQVGKGTTFFVNLPSVMA